MPTQTSEPSATDRVLVTGASGFVGSHLAGALSKTSGFIRGVGRRQNQADRYEYLSGDLTDSDFRRRVLSGVQTLVHCAGLAHQFGRRTAPEEFDRINRALTRRLVEDAASEGVERVVLLSSSSVYGSGRRGSREADEPRPDTAYGKSKWRAEIESRQLCKERGLDLTVVRPATVYGVGDPGNLRRLTESIATGRFRWIGDGGNLKSLVCVTDLAAAVQSILSRPAESDCETFNVAAPAVSMHDVVTSIASAAGTTIPALRLSGHAVSALLHAASAVTLGRGPAPRLSRTIDKWLSDDTIETTRFEQSGYPRVAWSDFRVRIQEEVDWIREISETTARRAA